MKLVRSEFHICMRIQVILRDLLISVDLSIAERSFILVTEFEGS